MADDRGLEAGAPPSDAFAALWAGCHRSTLRLAYVLTGDQTTAEDVVGDALARVYPAWTAGRVTDLPVYLRRAVVNEAIGRARRRATARRLEPALRTEAPRPVRFEDAVADADQLARALRRLPAKQRAAIVLRYLEDLSEADAADALGTSVGTVKAYVSRGLARLRADLVVPTGEQR